MTDKEMAELEMLRRFYESARTCVAALGDSPKSFFSNIKNNVEHVKEFYKEH